MTVRKYLQAGLLLVVLAMTLSRFIPTELTQMLSGLFQTEKKKMVTLKLDRIGKIKIGMTVDEAGNVLKHSFYRYPGYDGDECYYVGLQKPDAKGQIDPNKDKFSLMVSKNKVVRYEVDHGRFWTEAHAQIGMTKEAVLSLYGGALGALKVEPHKYTEGNYLVLTSDDPALKNYALVFEVEKQTDPKTKVARYVVKQIRAGLRPFAEYVEGCS